MRSHGKGSRRALTRRPRTMSHHCGSDEKWSMVMNRDRRKTFESTMRPHATRSAVSMMPQSSSSCTRHDNVQSRRHDSPAFGT
jgi:hypothetical protein